MLGKPGGGVRLAVSFALAVMAAAPGASAQDYPTSLLMTWEYHNNMAWYAFDRGDYNLAERRFNTAIKTLQKFETTDQRLLSRSYYDLSLVLHLQKRDAAAEPLAEWVLRVRERDPRTRDDVLFDALHLLSLIHRDQGHYPRAEALLRRTLEVEERNAGPDDPGPALTIKDIADVVARQRRYEEADALYRRAIAVQRHYDAEFNPALADALEGWVAVLDHLNRAEEARDAEAEVRRIRAAVGQAVGPPAPASDPSPEPPPAPVPVPAAVTPAVP